MALAFLLGFLLGALALVALEAAAALLLVRRLIRKQAAPADAPAADELPGERPFPYEKQVEWDANSCCACPCFPFDSIRFARLPSVPFGWAPTACLPAIGVVTATAGPIASPLLLLACGKCSACICNSASSLSLRLDGGRSLKRFDSVSGS